MMWKGVMHVAYPLSLIQPSGVFYVKWLLLSQVWSCDRVSLRTSVQKDMKMFYWEQGVREH